MAFAPTGSSGSRALYGIFVRLDASGVVTGATLANQSMGRIKTTARRTARSVDNVSDSMKKLQQQALQASAGLASVGFALAMAGKQVLGLTGHATQAAMGFEVAMARVKFATNATAEELKDLTKVMMDTGLATIETPESAANAFKQLRTAGLDTNEALLLLPKTIQMVTGAGGLMDMDAAVRVSVSAIKKFQHQGVPFSKTMDDIAQATRSTALSWEHMPAFFNSLRDAPMKLKATSAQMLALGGVMKAGGMQAAQAGESVAILANRLISNQSRINAFMIKKKLRTKEEFFEMAPEKLRTRMIMFQKMRIKLFDEAGKMRDLNKILAESIGGFQNILKTKGEEEAMVALHGVFGQKAGAMIMMLKQLTADGTDAATAINKLVKATNDSAGAMRQAEQEYLKTSAGIAKLIEGSKQTIATIFGSSTLGIVSKVLQAYKGFLNAMLKVIEANPALAKTVMVVSFALGALAVAAGVAAVGMAAVLFWSQVLGPALKAVHGLLGAAALGMKSLAAGARFAIIPMLSLVAVFGAIYGLSKAWEWVNSSTHIMAVKLRSYIDSIRLVVQGLVEWWNGKGGPNSMKLFQELDKKGLKNIVGGILQIKWVLEKYFKGLWNGAVLVGTIFNYIFGTLIGGALIIVAELLAKVFGLFIPSDLRGYASLIEGIGTVIGFIATVALVGYIAQTAIAIVNTTALGIAALSASLKVMAIAVAIALVIVAYGALLQSSAKAGEGLGIIMERWMRGLEMQLAMWHLKLYEIGSDISNWLSDGFMNGWDGFVSWISKQGKVLTTAFKVAIGTASVEDLVAARIAAGQIRTDTPDLANRATAESLVAARKGLDPSGSLKKAFAQEKQREYLREYYGMEVRRGGDMDKASYDGAHGGTVAVSNKMGGGIKSIGSLNINVVGDTNTREGIEALGEKIMEEANKSYDDGWEQDYS